MYSNFLSLFIYLFKNEVCQLEEKKKCAIFSLFEKKLYFHVEIY